ncbi:carbohydrate kinase family protein [Streptacidiphilus rugosus]|uniref:carbohydrate kinase family protein n=1 Tax=Streptacidiphilus rugosus TaxID=405783 RepID=UPI00068B4652|nr:carbohydrate kinase [Streptacidiphilus rugosus]
MISVVGEAVIDLVESPDGASAAHPGGSPANVAVGLGRLGVDVALLTRYGADPHGEMLARHLAGSRVRLLDDPVDDLPTSTALARPDANGVASYDFAIAWRFPQDPDPKVHPATACLHTGSIAATLLPGSTSVRALVERSRGRCTISYDPNCRPSLMGSPEQARPGIEALVALADVVKVSDEDLAWLHPGRGAADVAREWFALGPSLVIVTLGGEGSFGLCAAGPVERPALRVPVADTVGAGDAFTAGLLGALDRRGLLGADASGSLRRIASDELGHVLDEASLVSAITCTRPGADPPTVEELAAFGADQRGQESAARF